MKLRFGITLFLSIIVAIYFYISGQDRHSAQPLELIAQNAATAVSADKPVVTLNQTHDLDKNTSKKFANSGSSQAEKPPSGNIDETSSHPGFETEDGVAVIEGDIVLGESKSGLKYTGFSQSLQTWPGGVVPFVIQGDVEKPERVIQAISSFVDTGIKFVPYSGEGDALVFQNGSGNCKSYVGKVGGLQPLWVSPGCGSKELVHEIMHALGFIHEQNRDDRDSYIEVLWSNISEVAKINFEKFPADMMAVSGLGVFDFQSVMIYPPNMFARTGQQSMRPKSEGAEIAPSTTMSVGDILRLQRLSKAN